MTTQQIFEKIENDFVELVKRGNDGQFVLASLLLDLGYSGEKLNRLVESAAPQWKGINKRAKSLAKIHAIPA